MLINEHTALLSPKALLVPYSTHHVPAYHIWMQDAELQQLTASEPLTLDEEYDMQRSWRQDGDKLTFIACLPPTTTQAAEAGPSNRSSIIATHDDAPANMIGDVNLFLCEDDEQDEGAADADAAEPVPLVGEVEIMIADRAARARGHGRAVLATFLDYVLRNVSAIAAEYSRQDGRVRGCSISFLRVKIGAENARSIRLFESVGFGKVSETPNYFGEIEMRWYFREGGRMAEGQRFVELPYVLP
ncbi:hypothetical protein K490DRAFT_62171 [Saccharata proteae CBS 121410]|uniref:N-acetyltransferase domain-containing protein n=1 Tax=Saccharata proteae CBS 121410 TaxID=1314787 RepID=A0A9P4I1J5_9PEZI|nr:hypothetical protein K490DRAFT_62171 [Saccharata proteae CBS 121410]